MPKKNFDNISVGKHSYFYIDEIDNDFSDLVSKVIKENELKTRNVDLTNLNKVLLSEENELGLDYIHVALNSDNYNFKKIGIETINFFSGDYSSGLVIGKSEYSGEEIVEYTENDNREYIAEKYGDDAIITNLYDIYEVVCYTLTDFDLETAVSGAKSSSNTFNLVFANSNLVFYLTVVMFLIFVCMAMYIYYKLSIKAYKANVESDFVSSVLKISEQVSEDNIDETTAKAISQVIAEDIKKDKTLKNKKKKNDK